MPETGTETLDVDALVVDLLNADSQLGTFGLNGWYLDEAETPSGWPYGIVGWQGGVRVTYPGALFQAINGLIMVKLVGPASILLSTLRPAYQRVYQVLTGNTSSSSAIALLGKLYQEQPIDYSEPGPIAGQDIHHLGGAWRTLAG